MTEAQAIEARRLRSLGWKRIAIAARLGVTEGAINWATLTKKPPLLDIPAVTRLEAEALAYLEWFTAAHKRAPNVVEASQYMDVEPQAICSLLRALTRKGLINGSCKPTRPTA